MRSDAVEPAAVEESTEVMAAIEEEPAELIIADISTDDAYLTVRLSEAASLSAWR